MRKGYSRMAFKRLLALAVRQVPYFDGFIRCRGQLAWVLGVEGDCCDAITAISRMSVTHATATYTLYPVTGYWPHPAPVTPLTDFPRAALSRRLHATDAMWKGYSRMAFKRLLALAVGHAPHLDGFIIRCRGDCLPVGTERNCIYGIPAQISQQSASVRLETVSVKALSAWSAGSLRMQLALRHPGSRSNGRSKAGPGEVSLYFDRYTCNC